MPVANARVHVGRITIFPIKALDGVEVSESAITAGGILENDRTYAITDGEGRLVNGKRTERIHHLRSSFDSSMREVCLWENGESARTQFHLGDPSIHRWLGNFFDFPVILQHEPLKGFPDDRNAFGPTIVSEGSLGRVHHWYPALTLQNVRRRFRTNLELDAGEAFWEDRLFGAPEERKPFQVGPVRFWGHNPCQRCVVPTRDPDSSEPLRGFQKSFAELRREELPEWADARPFNHFYRLAVNTSIPASEAGKTLRVGDVIEV